MLIITFLLFTSVLYFAASDPVHHETSAAKPTNPSKTPQKPPLTTEEKQQCVDKFMSAVTAAYHTQFEPVVAGLPEDDQEYIETMMFDGVGSYLNWILSVIEQTSDPSATSEVTDEDLIISWQESGTFKLADAYHQFSVPNEEAVPVKN